VDLTRNTLLLEAVRRRTNL